MVEVELALLQSTLRCDQLVMVNSYGRRES